VSRAVTTRRAVLGGLAGLALAPRLRAAGVRVGLEVLESEGAGALRGRRAGLLLHACSVTAAGRSAVDVLAAAGVKVVKLFTPEHGRAGGAAAGEKVADGIDPETRLPLVSLYGAKTRPSPEDLSGLDALVLDLQDAGVRFYTYASTLLECLEAASESGVELVVLDRPNPLGGERVEGPLSDPPERVPRSFVNRAPGPLVHGLTLGEMARYANARRAKPAALRVVQLSGWTRDMVFADTGRAWIPPSPNLRSAEAALAYPGTCLIESTTASEGRGTEAPFLLVGAPWVNAEQWAREARVPGYALEPARFTPRASPAAPEPKHLGAECAGVRVRVTDPRSASPYRLGVSLLHALRRQPGFAWRDEGALDRLAGTRRLRESLERGASVDEILAADAADVAAYRRDRAASLVY
jgi:uncharacterized protein YbbC (DUF1343 family)